MGERQKKCEDFRFFVPRTHCPFQFLRISFHLELSQSSQPELDSTRILQCAFEVMATPGNIEDLKVKVGLKYTDPKKEYEFLDKLGEGYVS